MAHHDTRASRHKREPESIPPSLASMRDIWRKYPDPEIRNLLLEIHRMRRVLHDAREFQRSISRVWAAEVGGKLVGLEQLRILLGKEEWLWGNSSGENLIREDVPPVQKVSP